MLLPACKFNENKPLMGERGMVFSEKEIAKFADNFIFIENGYQWHRKPLRNLNRRDKSRYNTEKGEYYGMYEKIDFYACICYSRSEWL